MSSDSSLGNSKSSAPTKSWRAPYAAYGITDDDSELVAHWKLLKGTFDGTALRVRPCWRESILASIFGFAVPWAGMLLWTNNPRRAVKLGFRCSIIGTIGTFFVCRYRVAKQRHDMKQRMETYIESFNDPAKAEREKTRMTREEFEEKIREQTEQYKHSKVGFVRESKSSDFPGH